MQEKSRRLKSRREPLSAARIAAAALELIDDKGLDGFSYRSLAERLGCEAMSLYHYFPSKAHLFDAIVEIYLGELHIPQDNSPPLERMRRTCWNFRAAALRHPGFYQFMSVYRMNGRAGMAALNQVLKILEATGLPVEARARHFRVISYYVTGASLDEALGYAKGPSAAEPVPEAEARANYPAIMAVGPWFGREHHEKTFKQGLDVLLAAVQRDIDVLAGKPL
jgi:AcrR family transcriptional regulator